eukprot:TRINITY_DN47606_c0_g1_i1.p1 TRINITY_DN47606_c0_g1~~TRINITY_DN47606_c0_g1_i1.p1  ORF type:complete len:647 (-),score=157.82 TRINITY_DN47606_c0_g1_i1:39-1979(-)
MAGDDSSGGNDHGDALEAHFADIRALMLAERERASWARELLLREEMASMREEIRALRAGEAVSPKRCALPAVIEDVADAVDGKPCYAVDTLVPTTGAAANITCLSQGPCMSPVAAGAELDSMVRTLSPGTSVSQVSPTPPDDDEEEEVSVQAIMAQLAMQRSGSVMDLEKLVHETAENLLGSADKDEKKKPIDKAELVDSFLDPFVSIVIIVNSISIGVSIDVAPDWYGWLWIDVGFLLCYIVEALIKVHVTGWRTYLCGSAAPWNRFDVIIIAMGSFDAIANFMTYGSNEADSTPSLVILRVLRLTRIGRFFRVLHLKAFKELFLMIMGLAGALRTLLWALVILLFPIYVLSLLLTQYLGRVYLHDEMVQHHFSSLPRSMLMVFRCSVGDCSLNDGSPVILYLLNYGWFYGAAYVISTMLMTFGIFNLIMATFVDNALSVARRNELRRMRLRLSDQRRQARIVSNFIEKVWYVVHPDADPTHFDPHVAMHMKINADQFNELIDDPEVQGFLEELDVPEDDRRGLFDVLDADGGGMLEMEELLTGIVKLRGDPRRSDVVHVGLVLRSLQDEFRLFRSAALVMLEKLSRSGSGKGARTSAKLAISATDDNTNTTCGSSRSPNGGTPMRELPQPSGLQLPLASLVSSL